MRILVTNVKKLGHVTYSVDNGAGRTLQKYINHLWQCLEQMEVFESPPSPETNTNIADTFQYPQATQPRYYKLHSPRILKLHRPQRSLWYRRWQSHSRNDRDRCFLDHFSATCWTFLHNKGGNAAFWLCKLTIYVSVLTCLCTVINHMDVHDIHGGPIAQLCFCWLYKLPEMYCAFLILSWCFLTLSYSPSSSFANKKIPTHNYTIPLHIPHHQGALSKLNAFSTWMLGKCLFT